MGPKMTLGTLKMNGNDFPGVWGVLRGSNSVHDLISYIYWRQSDTVYCSRKGGCQRGKGWSKSFFLENKVVIDFNFRHGAKKIRSIGPPVLELWLFSVKEQNERVYKCDDSCNFFFDSSKFASSQLDFMTMGMI